MGLRVRVILFVVSTVLVAHVSWGVTRIRTQAELLRSDAARHGQELMRALAAPCSVPLATRQIEDLDAILARFSDETDWETLDLLEVAIVDTEGVVVAHTDPRVFGRRLDDGFTRQALLSTDALAVDASTEHALLLSMPIVAGLRWGTATAVVSLKRVEARIDRMRREVLAVSLGMAAFIALALYILLSAQALRPLGELTRAVREISAGELSARVRLEGRRDELGLLGDVINVMAEQIQQTTVGLEAMVQERTRALEDANSELERLARTDGLTSLANHRAFHEQLAREVDRAERYGQPLSLVMIDVDHFKIYNDANGHPAGDRVLAAISELFERRLRSVDLAARYGGEEFALILPATGVEAAARVAEQLVAAVRDRPFDGESTQPSGHVTISAGVALWQGKPETADGLVERADAALYHAKSEGRDRVASAKDEA